MGAIVGGGVGTGEKEGYSFMINPSRMTTGGGGGGRGGGSTWPRSSSEKRTREANQKARVDPEVANETAWRSMGAR